MSDLTFKAVLKPSWSQNIIMFVGLSLMEVQCSSHNVSHHSIRSEPCYTVGGVSWKKHLFYVSPPVH